MATLGEFELHAPVGRGGMGEVWRGVHRTQHVPVAIKILTSQLAQKPSFREAFRNEIEAVARLDHRSIVLVFDVGEVDAATAKAGPLVEGTPWLAMELVERGALDRSVPSSWPEVRAVLRSLLDGLAHAHARGVIHRDIKPGNVLLGASVPAQLTDFGLAHAVDRFAGTMVAGTPAYMAPEQFVGNWRYYGPWTDLYAVGCLSWALCTGAPPFGMIHDWARGQAAHAEQPLPVLRPRFTVPDGLEDWLHRLLDKAPRARFQAAADAAWALDRLPSVGADTVLAPCPPQIALRLAPTRPQPRRGDATHRVGATHTVASPALPLGPPTEAASVWVGPLPTLDGWRRDASDAPTTPRPTPTVTRPVRPGGLSWRLPEPTETVRPTAQGRPPMPADWRRAGVGAQAARIHGAGLGLFGLRTLPVVGRIVERDALWEALRRAIDTQRPHAVVLSGAMGCGRTRLAQWIGERASEVGAAVALWGTGEDVIGAALRRHLRVEGLAEGERLELVQRWLVARGELDPACWARLNAALAPGGDAVDRTAWLERISEDRPVVLTVDDAEDDLSSVALATAALDASMPLLVVIALREETVAEPAAEVTALLGRAGVQHLTLGPLPDEHRAELVRNLLGLDPRVAVDVEHRTGGNPRFAVELVGDWIRRGLLVPGRRGFTLRDARRAQISAAMCGVWEDRVRAALVERSTAERDALELFGVVGRAVDGALLDALSVAVGLDDVAATIARWTSLGLLRTEGTGWRLAHPALPEVLRARAEQGGRLRAWHARCAQLVSGRGEPGAAELVARHLLAAERFEAALDPLTVAVDERLRAGTMASASALLVERERALELGQVAPSSVAHAVGWTRWARLALEAGRLRDAEAWLRRAEAAARCGRWEAVLHEALLLRVALHRHRGEIALAWPCLIQAEVLASHDATGWRRGRCGVQRGRLLVASGALDRAAAVLRTARADLESAGDEIGVSEVLLELARVAADTDRAYVAQHLLTWASRRAEAAGGGLVVARCGVLAARLLRARGAMDEAARHAEVARERFRREGSCFARHAELELALQALDLHDAGLARSRVQRAVQSWTVQEHHPATRIAQLVLLVAHLEEGDRGAARRHLSRIEALSLRCPSLSFEERRLAERAAAHDVETALRLGDLLNPSAWMSHARAG